MQRYTVIGLMLDADECVVDQVDSPTPGAVWAHLAQLAGVDTVRRREVYLPLAAFDGTVHVQHRIQDMNLEQVRGTAGGPDQQWTVIALELSALQIGVLTIEAPSGPHAALVALDAYNNDMGETAAPPNADLAAHAMEVVAVLWGYRMPAAVFDPLETVVTDDGGSL